jgi:hypothetical protein
MTVETWSLEEWRIIWGMLMRSRRLAHDFPLPDDTPEHARTLDRMYRDVYMKIESLPKDDNG